MNVKQSKMTKLWLPVLAGLWCFVASSAYAAPSLSLGVVNGQPGDSVNVPVSFDNNGSVAGLQFDVQYDATQLTSSTATSGSGLAAGNGVESSQYAADVSRVIITPAADNALLTSGELVNIPFTILPQALAGDKTLTISNVVFTNVASFNEPEGVVTGSNVVVTNTLPVASNDVIGINEDQIYNGNLIATDGDGDALTYSVVANATNGAVVIDNAATGAFTYTPNSNFNGSDSFSFKVNDGAANSNIATVSINVAAINDAPVLSAIGNKTLAENSVVNVALSASDVEADTITLAATGLPVFISLVDNGNGTGSLSLAPGYEDAGSYNITINVTDNGAPTQSDSEVITVVVTNVNRAPVANSGAAAANEDQAYNGTMSANDADGDALSYALVSSAVNGSVVITNAATGAFSYTPNGNFSGSDSFTFKVNDGSVDSNIATVSINVATANDAPVLNAIGDQSLDENSSLNVPVSASDIDANAITLTATGLPAFASLVDNGDGTGSMNLLPGDTDAGSYVITITATDNGVPVLSDSEVITLTVNDVNQAPVAVDDDYSVDENSSDNALAVLTNDSDPESDVLAIVAVGATSAGGSVSINVTTDGLVYSPAADYVGVETFSYTVTDGINTTGGLVTVTVDQVITSSVASEYHVLNPRLATGNIKVVSLVDNNTISAGVTTLVLNLNEMGTVPASSVSQGMTISGTGSFSIGSAVNATDLPVPSEFAGTAFVVPQYRSTHYYDLLSLDGDALVQISAGSFNDTVSVPQGQVVTVNAGSGKSLSAVITSDLPILVTHRNSNNTDAMPIPPVSTDLWGVRSKRAYLGALEDGTTVSVYASNGATTSYSLNSGGYVTIGIGSTTSEGRGSALHVVADKPIGAAQFADSDGSEATSFWDASVMASHYGIPVDTQYIAVVCPEMDTSVTLTDGAAAPVVQVCSGDTLMPGKVYFGSSSDGVRIGAGAILESTKPVYVIYEAAATNDEHNLLGK